jgi:hypothetical protein
MATMGLMGDHIHLDKHTFDHSSYKGTICNALLTILFNTDYVHIYINKLI